MIFNASGWFYCFGQAIGLIKESLPNETILKEWICD